MFMAPSFLPVPEEAAANKSSDVSEAWTNVELHWQDGRLHTGNTKGAKINKYILASQITTFCVMFKLDIEKTTFLKHFKHYQSRVG